MGSKRKNSSLLSFKSFFCYGTSNEEFLIIKSVKKLLSGHITSVLPFVLENSKDLKKSGEYSVPSQHQLQLQNVMINTQMFTGYIEEKKNAYLTIEKNSNLALFIADWVYFNWKVYRRKKL